MKKAQKLGMNPSTASNRLVKDLLFKFVVEAGHKCYRCDGDLSREDFSIEHKEAWLYSDNPKALYFNLSNVAFSHKKCNLKATRMSSRRSKSGDTVKVSRKNYDRSYKRTYDPKKRRERYLKTGW